MTRRLLLAAAAALLFWGTGPAKARDAVDVGVALQAVYSIAAALADGTHIAVTPIPAVLPGMAQLPRALARANAAVSRQLGAVDAVVTIASIWPDDPLFREARARNIWVIAVDAARSLGKDATNVALIAQPATDVPWRAAVVGTGESPYAWLSPANGIRMAEIVANDFKRLAPDDAARIEANRAAFAARLQALRAEFEAKFAVLADAHLYALTDRFVYLTNEFGVFIDGYFLEDDVRWTPEDFANVTALLKDQGVRRVLHHWQPNDAVAAAVAAAGATLLILDDGENTIAPAAGPPDPDGYIKVLRADLEALYRALGQ